MRTAHRKGKRIVATHGCFDILHVGHVRNLEASKKLGDLLIVGINSDASVRRIKGPARPIVPARERAEVLAGLAAVDYVFIFSGSTPFSWIGQLPTHVHVKGGGEDVRSHPRFNEMKSVIESGGNRLVLVPHHAGRSSSAIIRKAGA